MNNLKSKNSGPQDRPQIYPNVEILTIPMHHMRIEMINNNKNRMDSQLSSKNLEILRQSHQSSSGNLRLDNSVNRSTENLIKKTPTRTKVCTSIDKIPVASQNNLSLSPHTYAYVKPQMKQVDDQLNILSCYPQKQNIIQDDRREQIISQLKETQQLLQQKEQENQKLQEINQKLSQENQKLYNSSNDMFKDIEIMRQNFDQQNNEYMMLKQQNQQLIEDVRLIQNERNQTQTHSDQILNLKNFEIQQLQNELREYKQLLQNQDLTISNLKQQLDISEQQEIKRKNLNQYLKNSEKSYFINKDQQNENLQKIQQQDFNSKRSSMQSEILYYQSQLEQIQSEKNICEQKLIEYQSIINQFVLNEKKINGSIDTNIIQQKQHNKLKQIVQIQKKQIESQQKTIMNQHYEIQNLQTLLYSTEQDSQYLKNSVNFNEQFLDQQSDICDIRQKENNPREHQFTQGMYHISIQQPQATNAVVEDTFRNMQKELELYNSFNDQ